MRIGIALSGGGALGAAHIGVLEALLDAGLSFDHICGTSAGAIIGLLLADGGFPAMERFLHDLQDAGITGLHAFPLPRTPDRLFSSIMQVLRKRVKATSFAELPCAFSCVATDIGTGTAVELVSGDPVIAVMASAAYPGVFPAQQIGGRWLVDGGVTKNLPADLLRSGVDYLIGSSLYAVAPLRHTHPSTRPSRIHTALRALEIQQRTLSEAGMTYCDFCLTPPVEIYKWYDFTHITALRELGRNYTMQALPSLLAQLSGSRAM